MKLVIDIPDYDIEMIKEYYEGHDIVSNTYSYIYHGQPLSEILDKISAEIEEMKYPRKASKFDAEYFFNEGVDRALDVVEKYKGTRNDRSK